MKRRGVKQAGAQTNSPSLRIWKARTMSVIPFISAQILSNTSSTWALSMKNLDDPEDPEDQE